MTEYEKLKGRVRDVIKVMIAADRAERRALEIQEAFRDPPALIRLRTELG